MASSRTWITTEVGANEMRETSAPMTEQQAAARRQGVRRTVLIFVVVAVAIYAGFILSGVLSQ